MSVSKGRGLPAVALWSVLLLTPAAAFANPTVGTRALSVARQLRATGWCAGTVLPEVRSLAEAMDAVEVFTPVIAQMERIEALETSRPHPLGDLYATAAGDFTQLAGHPQVLGSLARTDERVQALLDWSEAREGLVVPIADVLLNRHYVEHGILGISYPEGWVVLTPKWGPEGVQPDGPPHWSLTPDLTRVGHVTFEEVWAGLEGAHTSVLRDGTPERLPIVPD